MKILQSSFPEKQKKFLVELLEAFPKIETKPAIAETIQKALRHRFDLNANVAVGEDFGFAVKIRKSAVFIAKQKNHEIIVWCSPLTEGFSKNSLTPLPTLPEGEPTVLAKVAVEKSPKLGDLDFLSQLSEIVSCVSVVFGVWKTSKPDLHLLAQKSRAIFMKHDSPIWHVLVGSDFVVCPAENAKSLVRMKINKKFHLTAFKHSEAAPNAFWQSVKENWTLILVVVLMAVFMAGKKFLNTNFFQFFGILVFFAILYKGVRNLKKIS